MKRRWLRRQGLVLALVMGLVGHLWMQSSHRVASAERMAAAHTVATGAHDGHDGHDGDRQPSDEHPSLCSALPSGDHPVTQGLLRCSATASAAHALPVVDQPLATVDQRPEVHRRSPRSPDHGVVLVI